VAAAFLTVYVVWGSTYLGIKIAIETLPPLLMAGARFVIAGALMHLVLRARGIRLEGALHWRNAAIVGVALLAGGNGGVTWAERTIPSGVAALVIGSAPLWFAVIDWLRPGGSRPAARTWAGIAIGFAGVVMLVWPGVKFGGLDPWGIALLLVACVSWASGSIFSKQAPRPGSALAAIAAQMWLGGAALLLASVVAGEWGRFDWRQVSARSAGAMAYLIVVGSWLGFSAYIWLLKVSTPTKVSSYAYVNPIVAVFLGWAVLGETVSSRMLWAAAVILVGVAVLTTPSGFLRDLLRVRRSIPCPRDGGKGLTERRFGAQSAPTQTR
jgi:drug/metabolite transporter (DMT)-like permease